MSKTLRTVGMVVAAVALVATGVGALAGAGVLGAAAAGSAGVVAGMSVATISAIGTYAGIAASVIGAIAASTAPGFSAEGSASTFRTNPQSGLPYAMGRTRMSGLRCYARTYDGFKQQSKDDILAFVALLTIAGPIQGIERFTADNEVVSFAAGGNAVGRFSDYMGQQLSLGAKSGPALGMNFGGKSFPEWTAAHKLSGMAHAQWAMRFDTKGDLYGAGAPEPAWIGKWVLVYDPRLDSTYPGGSGSCRPLQEDTYVWSDNPGLHALTWSLGRWLNGKRVCGIGAPVENIRVAEFVECANVCEANAWKVGGVEWTTDSKWDTLKRILQAGGAMPTKTGAMIGCMVSTPRTAIATIESRHLHDGASFPMTKSRRDRFNTVIPRYVDEDSDWAVVSGKAVSEPVYVTADGGQRTKEIDFPLVQVFSGEEAKQPGQLAAYAIVDSREAGPWTFSTGPEWLGLKTGDVVYLNVPEEGIANQPVLITRRSLDPASAKVSFTVQTETYAKHAYALGETTVPPAPFSLTAPALRPAAPLALNWNVAGTTSGEGFPALLVTGESQHPSADAVFIDYRRSGTEAWTSSAILSAVDPVSHVIAPLESESAYDVRIGYRIGTIDGDVTIFTNVTTGLGKVTIIDGKLNEALDAIDAAHEAIDDIDELATGIIQKLGALPNGATVAQELSRIEASAGDGITAANGRIDTVSTVAAGAGEAVAQVKQMLQVNAEGQSARLVTTEQAVATALDRTSGARWSKEAVAGNGRAQLTVYAFDNNGNLQSGVDIIGDLTISGDLFVSGSVTTGKLAANAASTPWLAFGGSPNSDPSLPGSGYIAFPGAGVKQTILSTTVSKADPNSVLEVNSQVEMYGPDAVNIYIDFDVYQAGSPVGSRRFILKVDGNGTTNLPFNYEHYFDYLGAGTYDVVVSGTRMDGNSCVTRGVYHLRIREFKR